VLTGLRYLKENNHLYRDIKMLDDWSERAATDDKELWKALTNQEHEKESDEEPPKAADESEDTNSSNKKTVTTNKQRGKRLCKRKTANVRQSRADVNVKGLKTRKRKTNTRKSYVGESSDCTLEVIPSGTGYYGSLKLLPIR
jgi:hypothetical protein